MGGCWAIDICLETLDDDPHSAFVGAGLDFKAARKQVKVAGGTWTPHVPLQGKLYHCVVCHFRREILGILVAKSAFLLRQCHELLAFAPHKAGCG